MIFCMFPPSRSTSSAWTSGAWAAGSSSSSSAASSLASTSYTDTCRDGGAGLGAELIDGQSVTYYRERSV